MISFVFEIYRRDFPSGWHFMPSSSAKPGTIFAIDQVASLLRVSQRALLMSGPDSGKAEEN
jgi:hypothetical protein